MPAGIDRLEFSPPATPGQLRALMLALLAHGLLLAALAWGVHWQRDAQFASFDAELWSAVPQEAAAQAPEPPAPPEPLVPAPLRPEPTAPMPAPPAVDIVLQQQRLKEQQTLERAKQQEIVREHLKKEKINQQLEKDRLAKDKLGKARLDKQRLEKLKQDKLKQVQAEQARQAALDKKITAEQAKQLQVQREKTLRRLTGLAGATVSASSTGSALKASGPSARYAGRISARVKPNIVFTEEAQGNPTAEVEVRTAPDGTIVGRKITKSSGLDSWDIAVLKAIDKTEKLPRDIDGSMPPILTLVFRPKD